MHRRSGVARKPFVPPAQPGGRQSPSHRLSASAHQDRSWPATRQFLRRDSSPVAGALCNPRASCRLGSMSPQRPVIVQHSDRVAFRVAVLSRFPTSTTSCFSQCPISGPSPFVAARHRRPRQIPLPREDIPTFLISRAFSNSAWPGCESQFRLLSLLSKVWCSMASAGRILVWWDRDVDHTGRPIRSDVRLAGHEIWEQACQRTKVLLDDLSPAAELMENSIAQVSRYLDRIGAPESSQKHGLLMVAFCRGLRRYAAKLNRLEFVGGAGELSSRRSSLRPVP